MYSFQKSKPHTLKAKANKNMISKLGIKIKTSKLKPYTKRSSTPSVGFTKY